MNNWTIGSQNNPKCCWSNPRIGWAGFVGASWQPFWCMGLWGNWPKFGHSNSRWSGQGIHRDNKNKRLEAKKNFGLLCLGCRGIWTHWVINMNNYANIPFILLKSSTEFVQEFADLLRDRAVVYLNVDLISHNQSLFVPFFPSISKCSSISAMFALFLPFIRRSLMLPN